MSLMPAIEAVATSLPPLCSPQQVSEMTGIPVNTLAFWRVQGQHLPFVKLGRVIRYRREDVVAYLNDHTFTSTAEAKARYIEEES